MPSDRVSAAIDLHFDFKKIKNVHFGMNVQHVLKQNNARGPTSPGRGG